MLPQAKAMKASQLRKKLKRIAEAVHSSVEVLRVQPQKKEIR